MNNVFSIKFLPLILFLTGLLVVVYLFFSRQFYQRSSFDSRASAADRISVTGQINDLPSCLDSFVCYEIVEDQSGIHYNLYSKRFPKLLSKGAPHFILNLKDYVGKTMTVSGFYVPGEVPYLIITDIKESR